MRYLDMLVRGGVMMVPIGICLLTALWLVVDRFIAFHRVDTEAPKVLAYLRSLFHRVDRNAVIAFCDERNSVVCRLFREAVVCQSGGETRMHIVLTGVQHEEAALLERRLPLLGLSAVSAPLLGFLGTLIGIISALRAVELHPAIAGSEILAGRLWSALLPSAFGLAVGIPAYCFFLYFTSRVRQTGHLLKSSVPKILDILTEPAPSAEHRAPLPDAKGIKRSHSYDDDEFFRRKTEVKTR